MNKIVLISCVKKKLSRRANTRELYSSPLFRMNIKFAETLKPDNIFILSAKHGLVGLEEEISPYNQTLNEMSIKYRKLWAGRVIDSLSKHINFKKDKVVFLAGKKYREFLISHFHHYEVPLEGLSIGKQLQFLKSHI